MNAAVPEHASALPLRPATAPKALSLSATGYALLALCAIVAARGIAPALPGTTTGIARLISAAVWFAACVSQLIAAGGIGRHPRCAPPSRHENPTTTDAMTIAIAVMA